MQSYLHSAFVVQLDSHEDGDCNADSGTSCHMTHDKTGLYGLSPPPLGRDTITTGDQRRIKVEYVRNIDVIFRRYTGERATLIGVSYVPGIGFNLFSLHAVQKTHLIVSNASGTYIVGINLISLAALVDHTCVRPGSSPGQ